MPQVSALYELRFLMYCYIKMFSIALKKKSAVDTRLGEYLRFFIYDFREQHMNKAKCIWKDIP